MLTRPRAVALVVFASLTSSASHAQPATPTFDDATRCVERALATRASGDAGRTPTTPAPPTDHDPFARARDCLLDTLRRRAQRLVDDDRAAALDVEAVLRSLVAAHRRDIALDAARARPGSPSGRAQAAWRDSCDLLLAGLVRSGSSGLAVDMVELDDTGLCIDRPEFVRFVEQAAHGTYALRALRERALAASDPVSTDDARWLSATLRHASHLPRPALDALEARASFDDVGRSDVVPLFHAAVRAAALGRFEASARMLARVRALDPWPFGVPELEAVLVDAAAMAQPGTPGAATSPLALLASSSGPWWSTCHPDCGDALPASFMVFQSLAAAPAFYLDLPRRGPAGVATSRTEPARTMHLEAIAVHRRVASLPDVTPLFESDASAAAWFEAQLEAVPNCESPMLVRAFVRQASRVDMRDAPFAFGAHPVVARCVALGHVIDPWQSYAEADANTPDARGPGVWPWTGADLARHGQAEGMHRWREALVATAYLFAGFTEPARTRLLGRMAPTTSDRLRLLAALGIRDPDERLRDDVAGPPTRTVPESARALTALEVVLDDGAARAASGLHARAVRRLASDHGLLVPAVQWLGLDVVSGEGPTHAQLLAAVEGDAARDAACADGRLAALHAALYRRGPNPERVTELVRRCGASWHPALRVRLHALTVRDPAAPRGADGEVHTGFVTDDLATYVSDSLPCSGGSPSATHGTDVAGSAGCERSPLDRHGVESLQVVLNMLFHAEPGSDRYPRVARRLQTLRAPNGPLDAYDRAYVELHLARLASTREARRRHHRRVAQLAPGSWMDQLGAMIAAPDAERVEAGLFLLDLVEGKGPSGC